MATEVNTMILNADLRVFVINSAIFARLCQTEITILAGTPVQIGDEFQAIYDGKEQTTYPIWWDDCPDFNNQYYVLESEFQKATS